MGVGQRVCRGKELLLLRGAGKDNKHKRKGAVISMNTVVICFANNKGGSGKSTTCANVGYALAALGNKVLLIDGDMQMNLSLSFFTEEEVLQYAQGQDNLYYAIKNQRDLEHYIVPAKYENIDIVPSSTLMSSIEYELFTKWQRELILKKCLRTVREKGNYDYILIDAPPTLGGWVMNILCASDHVIIPVEATPWGMFGLGNMFEFLDEVRQIAENLRVLGIVVTKADTRKNYFKQTFDSLRELGEVHVFESYIRIDSSVEWSQDNNMPIMAYRKNCRSAGEYTALAEELERKLKEA